MSVTWRAFTIGRHSVGEGAFVEATIEQQIVADEEEPKLGRLSDRLCAKHGLHFNPILSQGCAHCKQEQEQERQARLALLIVAMVQIAVIAVMVHVTWSYFQTDRVLETRVIESSTAYLASHLG